MQGGPSSFREMQKNLGNKARWKTPKEKSKKMQVSGSSPGPGSTVKLVTVARIRKFVKGFLWFSVQVQGCLSKGFFFAFLGPKTQKRHRHTRGVWSYVVVTYRTATVQFTPFYFISLVYGPPPPPSASLKG